MRTARLVLVVGLVAGCSADPTPLGPTDAGAGGDADAAPLPDADAGALPDATVGFTLGGSVTGLAPGESVVLANDAVTLTVSADGPFAFSAKLPDGAPFDVRVAAPPPSQACRVTGGAGSVKGADVTSIAVTCRPRWAYLPGWTADAQSVFSGDVVMYRATSSGSLAVFAPPSALELGKEPTGIAVHPSGDHVYVSDYLAKVVFQLDVGSDGRLAPMTVPSLPVSVEPNGVTVHPAGIAVYVVANYKVFQFAVDSAGALAPMKAPSVASAFLTRSLVVDAAGKHAYAANEADGTLSQYDVGSDGALTPMTQASVTIAPANEACGVLALHPAGSWAYVACRGSSSTVGVVQLAIAKDGTVSSLGPVATPPTGYTTNVTVHPSGKWAYAVSSTGNLSPGRLSQYVVGPDGKLTAMSTASVPTGVEPVDVSVDARGENVFVVDAGLMFANGPVGADVFRYTVDPKTGALTYAETIATPSKKNPRAVAFTR